MTYTSTYTCRHIDAYTYYITYAQPFEVERIPTISIFGFSDLVSFGISIHGRMSTLNPGHAPCLGHHPRVGIECHPQSSSALSYGNSVNKKAVLKRKK